MNWILERKHLQAAGARAPRYEFIAQRISEAITAGQLRADEKLPPIRHLAEELGVSATTVAAAYDLLTQRGWIRGEVGRGSFVNSRRAAGNAAAATGKNQPVATAGRGATFPAPWRKRTLTATATRLRAAFPTAADCSTGRPDSALLPWTILQRAWKAAIEATTHDQLQYAGAETVVALARTLLPQLAADGVNAGEGDLVVGSSAQQFMTLAMQIAASRQESGDLMIAVEEPGYPTIFDTYERAGYSLIGVEVDRFGAVPASLEAALRAGATAALFTPRAHNPTGASWSVERARQLADVLAAHAGVLAVEDDHFPGAVNTRPGSLLSDERIEERVVYIRSFSKTIGPDLRLAIAVARPRLRALLAEAKSFADGWSSKLAQRALANALADRKLSAHLATACRAYAERRETAAVALDERLARAGGGAWGGADGVNIWVRLPVGVDAHDVVERAAAAGVLVAPGEAFFIRPGRGDVLRFNAGSVDAAKATLAAKSLAKMILTATTAQTLIPV